MFQKAFENFSKNVSERVLSNEKGRRVAHTMYLWKFALFKVPLILFCRPVVLELTDDRIELKIPLTKATKNHLQSMYFGALAIGADCAGGLLAMKLLQQSSKKFSFAFKDLHADFLKRADGDVHFICNDGKLISQFVTKVLSSDERQNQAVQVIATVPSKYGEEPVAKFELTLSARSRS